MGHGLVISFDFCCYDSGILFQERMCRDLPQLSMNFILDHWLVVWNMNLILPYMENHHPN